MEIFEMPGDCDQSMKQIVAMYKTIQVKIGIHISF